MRSFFLTAGLAAVIGLATPSVADPVPTPKWTTPLSGYLFVVRPFAPPAQRWQAGHRGVDLAAPPGTAVRAAGSGVVRFAGVVVSRPLISIAHEDDLITTYEPVIPSVAQGDRVVAGQTIGVLAAGHAGCPSGCLHFGLRHEESYLDPMALIGRVRVRLLPVAGPATRRPAGRTRRRCCRSGR